MELKDHIRPRVPQFEKLRNHICQHCDIDLLEKEEAEVWSVLTSESRPSGRLMSYGMVRWIWVWLA